MKFAKYLQQTQTPEWKRAYIDYRGLKKKIHKETSRPSSDSQFNLPPTSEPEHYADELGDDAPTTSRLRHDAGMGLGELPIRRKSFTARKTASQSSVTDVNQPAHNRKPSASSAQLSRTISGAKKPKSQMSKGFLTRASTLRSPPHPFAGSIPLHDLIPLLSPQEVSFIDALDKELEKIEKFYDTRKKEMETRTKLLQAQLIELNLHHQRFHEAQARNSQWNVVLHFVTKFRSPQASMLEHLKPNESSSQKGKTTEIGDSLPHVDSGYSSTSKHDNPLDPRLDPDEYQAAKKKLNKAVLEHYRGLEMLQNYRILNITGFRKALKKFEKFICLG
ncbi:SPX domain-containing protein [Lentinula raphanica]|nr:SPX domain-containing protein [Lentinula raphanica]